MSHQEHTSLDLPLGGKGDADGIRCAAVQGVSQWESRGFVTKRTASPLCSNVANRVFPQAAK